MGSEPRRAGTGGLVVAIEAGRNSAKVGEVGNGGTSSSAVGIILPAVALWNAAESLGVETDLLAILGLLSSFAEERVSSVISLFLFLRVRKDNLLPMALRGRDAAVGAGGGGGGEEEEERKPMTGGPASGDLGGGAKAAKESCLVSFFGRCCWWWTESSILVVVVVAESSTEGAHNGIPLSPSNPSESVETICISLGSLLLCLLELLEGEELLESTPAAPPAALKVGDDEPDPWS